MKTHKPVSRWIHPDPIACRFPEYVTDDDLVDFVHNVASVRDVEGINELLGALDDLREDIAGDYRAELAEYARDFVPPHPAEGLDHD